jgi:hypothetical protein
MQDGSDNDTGGFAFQDARDLHGAHAGLPLSAESLLLLWRLADCAQRLKALHLPLGPLEQMSTDTVQG